ncbi:MAG: hypothetical protein ACP6IY_05055 [Promethearchaeia archaeon]
MIWENNDGTRIFLIFIIQTFVIVFSIYILIKIFTRRKDPTSFALSGFYICYILTFIINDILFFLKIKHLVNILYLIGLFFVIFSYVFLLIFDLFMLYPLKMNKKLVLLTLLIYSTAILIIILIPDGFIINESTNWRPIWCWSFLFIIYIFLIGTLLVPMYLLSLKIYFTIKLKSLKKKWFIHYIGIIISSLLTLGGFLYITWQNSLFRIIWSFLSLLIFPAAILVYFGIGKSFYEKSKKDNKYKKKRIF